VETVKEALLEEEVEEVVLELPGRDLPPHPVIVDVIHVLTSETLANGVPVRFSLCGFLGANRQARSWGTTPGPLARYAGNPCSQSLGSPLHPRTTRVTAPQPNRRRDSGLGRIHTFPSVRGGVLFRNISGNGHVELQRPSIRRSRHAGSPCRASGPSGTRPCQLRLGRRSVEPGEGREMGMHPNEKLLRDMDQAQIRGDVESFAEFFTDDVIVHITGKSPSRVCTRARISS
jgi:hypothetical protein